MRTVETAVNAAIMYRSPQVVILWDGTFYEPPAPCTIRGRPPINTEDIRRAKEARSCGIPGVVVPAPEYVPAAGVPVGGTREHIESTLAAHRDGYTFGVYLAGRVITGWDSLHADGCQCDNCPSEPVYGNHARYEVGFYNPASPVPSAWFVMPEQECSTIRVQTTDGEHLFEGALNGGRAGKYDQYRKPKSLRALPEEVMSRLTALCDAQKRQEAENTARYREQRIRELCNIFGVSPEEIKVPPV